MKLLALLLVLGSGTVFADPIVPNNNSFENSSPGFGNPAGWALFFSSVSPTFSSYARVFVNDGENYDVVSGVTGSQLAAVNLDHNAVSPENPDPVVPPNGSLDGLVSGNFGTFSALTTYRMTASLGLENALDVLDVGLALGTGAPSLADTFPAPVNPAFAYLMINGANLTSGALQDFTVSLDTATFSGLVGQPINLSLLLHSEAPFGRVAFFDNVRLSSASDVPEPNNMIQVSAGAMLIALGIIRRKRYSCLL